MKITVKSFQRVAFFAAWGYFMWTAFMPGTTEVFALSRLFVLGQAFFILALAAFIPYIVKDENLSKD